MKPPWPTKWLEAAIAYTNQQDVVHHTKDPVGITYSTIVDIKTPNDILDALEAVGALHRPKLREYWFCQKCCFIGTERDLSRHSDYSKRQYYGVDTTCDRPLVHVREVLDDEEGGE